MKKKYRFPHWLEKPAKYFTPAVAVLSSVAVANATAMDSLGNYLNGGFTGPLSKAVATGILMLSAYGLKTSEGRAHNVCLTGAIASGGVLAAPVLMTEFKTAVGGVLLMPLPHMAHLLPFLH